MTIYLIKNDNTYKTFNNIIEWNEHYVAYQGGKGIGTIYASEDEYFTDVEPVEQQ